VYTDRDRLQPPVLIPIVKPFIGKSAMCDVYGIFRPMEHVFVSLMNFQEHRGVTSHVRVEELRLTAIGVPDEYFEFGIHQIRLFQIQMLQGSVADRRQINQYGTDG
jgi:hypothetical protein